MGRNQYFYIGFNAQGQRIFFDDTKNQMLKGNENAIYVQKNKKQFWINCVVVCLLLWGTYMLDIRQLGAEICLVISGVEGTLFALVSRYYTNKINALFFKTAQPYQTQDKEEWVSLLRSGKKMVWTFIGIRLTMIFCAVVISFLTMGFAEPILLIFNIFIWWGLIYFFASISVTKVLLTLRTLARNQGHIK